MSYFSSDKNDVLSADEPTAILTPEDLRLFKKAEVRKRILNKKGKKKKDININRFTKCMCFIKRKRTCKEEKVR